jgi:hypothetical protein
MLLWLIRPRNSPERNRQSVPAVDRYHRQRQIDEFDLAELLPYPLIDIVRHLIAGNQ